MRLAGRRRIVCCKFLATRRPSVDELSCDAHLVGEWREIAAAEELGVAELGGLDGDIA